MRPIPIIISKKIEQKLNTKHRVNRTEVEECFFNRVKGNLIDSRGDHRTKPPTEWFIAKTDSERLLKVVFVFDHGKVFIKSCFDADKESIRIYNKVAK
jgi:hypothetical protein